VCTVLDELNSVNDILFFQLIRNLCRLPFHSSIYAKLVSFTVQMKNSVILLPTCYRDSRKMLIVVEDLKGNA